MRIGRRLLTCALTMASFLSPVAASAQVGRISALSDVSFGTVSTAADVSRAQTVCAFSSNLGRYTVTATGSGSGGAFTLANGPAALPYEVQWSQASGATTGTNLTAGVPLSGQTSDATGVTCLLGLLSSGSLIVLLRATALQSAAAGDYSGTLSILLSPQ
jgi:hypothetical protein